MVSNNSSTQTISSSQDSINLTLNESAQPLEETFEVCTNQCLLYSQSNVDTSPQNLLPVTNDSPSISRTVFIGKAPNPYSSDPVSKRVYVTNHVIVRFTSQINNNLSISNEAVRMAHEKVGAKVKKDFSAEGISGLQVVQLPNGKDVQSAIKEYQSNPNVLYAEPDYVISISPDQTGLSIHESNPIQILSTPNDPRFVELWGLRNSGQSILGSAGTHGADINATAAWNISTGSDNVIVAVVDTGVLYSHSDLSTNIWTNPGEISGNGIDDDQNGYIDDVHGWNFVTNNPDPIDDNGHGTHVSGTIGAVGNNAIGIAGVNWHTKIMVLKTFDSLGSGLTSDAISAILYADANGASVISNSWSGPDFEQSLNDTISASSAVVVCAAGNDGQLNNDKNPQYPASFSSANIISVAASDQNDQLASFSHYGPISVDLAAPGVNILSTLNVPGTYGYKDGTSMATPHVSGVAALVKSVNPSLTAVQIKNIILSTVDVKNSFDGMVASGGRLNAYNAIVSSYPPVANFTATPRNGSAPLTVIFTDLSGNAPTGWTWDFGDGNITNSTMQNPVHTYQTGGTYSVALNVSNAGGFSTFKRVGYINVANVTATKIGVYNSGNWYIDYNGDGLFNTTTGDKYIPYGTSGWTKLTGDWNGDGKSEIGIYKDAVWYLDYGGSGVIDANTKYYEFGAAGWTPLTGDWNGDKKDEIGVYNAGNWYLDFDGTGDWSSADRNYAFGTTGWMPVTGKWTGDAYRKIGIYNAGNWYIDLNGDGLFNSTTGDKYIPYGTSGWTQLTGDWNGDGRSEIGIYKDAVWYLDYGSSGVIDANTKYYQFGAAGWTPIVGDWNADTKDEIGVYNAGNWYLDYDGTGVWSAGDRNYGFGKTGLMPVIGKWN